jgi:hypothetical protein
MKLLSLVVMLCGFLIAGGAGYQYYLHTPTYALHQISDAAERQDQITLAKYIDFDSIIANLTEPLETAEESYEKRAQEETAEAKVRMRNSTAADDPIEKMKESELDLEFQRVKIGQRAKLFTLRMETISMIRNLFAHFDSCQIMNIARRGDTYRIRIKDKTGTIVPIIMSSEHKAWHVTEIELPENIKN